MEDSQSSRRQPSVLESGRSWARVVPCAEHGTSAWCYIQEDGSHIDSDQCCCNLMPSAYCPVDAHRATALVLHPEGMAGLFGRSRGTNGHR
ncbi:hypothetical protein [Sphaerobacter sp.]|uniref:hypothetical protein n=1 Tax=Sphaerobacter sp. TaxID=2099654 RepID=UPI001E10629F|nr:hypothetical protein [Sphaerobacter sp.]MBX5444534.1 hypothetical protein [Sphaerobacter sp.]